MLNNLKEFSLPEIEKKVLDFWRTNDVFKKVEAGAKNKRKFVFYEGPPTANGRPGLHHILSRSFKDIVLRYKTMRGFRVLRRGGWDTHGLPVEIEVEKQLNLRSKKDIERYGIAEFNKKCKESVWSYKEDWERLTERIGFWIDMERPYITYENSYIETIWWIVKQIADKKLLYKAHRVAPWCPRCGTVLSSHELALGYKEVEEPSLFVQFKLRKGQTLRQAQGKQAGRVSLGSNAYILSWTTTPWTLPGNVALAVGARIKYLVVKKDKGEVFIVAEPLKDVLNFEYKTLGVVNGKDLIGLKYEPLFSVIPLKSTASYKVYPADFVTTEEGTGVVHTAVMYGEDDYLLGQKVGLPQHHTVNERGEFTKDVKGFSGKYVKSKETEEKIFAHLKKNNNLFGIQPYKHDYPFCWRCNSPVLYYARDSWFIGMSKLRKKLIDTNEKINWIPKHIKHGRFGEWLKEVKDWAISRERYWGTPLPIWECSGCGKEEVIGGFKELSDRTGGVRNRYILMRHGEAQSNKKRIVNCSPKDKNLHSLTLKGRVEAEKSAGQLKKESVDLIFASDFRRTKETAEVVGNALDIDIKLDRRLREINVGVFNGGPVSKYHAFFANTKEKFVKKPPKGENLREVTKRIHDFFMDMEDKHKDKTILVVSHEYPLWMAETILRGWGEENSVWEKSQAPDFISTGEVREVELLNLPRDEWGFADPHKPYVDDVSFECKKCGKQMKRVKEVMDCWFDSGAMPFAQAHYPFAESAEHKIQGTREKNKKQSSVGTLPYPADFIVEGMDQTRGWFYTLHAISNLLGQGASYKNVISHGLVLDNKGQKMSKSKGNVVSPWDASEKFGADAIRWYFYTVNSPGEPKKFDDKEINKVLRSFIFLIYNSFLFLNTYAPKVKISAKNLSSTAVLDQWIIARLAEVEDGAGAKLNDYDVSGAARDISVFIDDLSRWYIRRSRKRFSVAVKGSNGQIGMRDYETASSTLAYALLSLSKLLAPFTPFMSEALYQSLAKNVSGYKFLNSVHLEKWPTPLKGQSDKKARKRIIEDMAEVRRLASLALAEREQKKIKVRQPLQELRIKNRELSKKKKLMEVLGDEVNVKQVVYNGDLRREVALDSRLTHELKEEGWFRELVRAVQGMRQDAKLKPGEKIALGVEGEDEIMHIVRKYKKALKQEVSASRIEYKSLRGFNVKKETKIDEWFTRLTIKS